MLLKTYKNYVLLVLCGILTILNVIIAINGAGSGVAVTALQKKEANLTNQKRELQDQLVKSLSLQDLQEKSESLGFAKPGVMVYLSETSPVANIP